MTGDITESAPCGQSQWRSTGHPVSQRAPHHLPAGAPSPRGRPIISQQVHCLPAGAPSFPSRHPIISQRAPHHLSAGALSPSGRPVSPASCRSWKHIWALLVQQLRSRPCPLSGCNYHRTRTRSRSVSGRGSGHQDTSHTLFLEENGQHTLRKKAAVIHNKNSPSTKNVKPMQAGQGWAHVN